MAKKKISVKKSEKKIGRSALPVTFEKKLREAKKEKKKKLRENKKKLRENKKKLRENKKKSDNTPTCFIGNRAAVLDGLAQKTSGGLRMNDLMINKKGKIVSRKQSEAAKKRFGK